MALKRNKRGGRPSPYPRLLFHGLRSMQLLSSIVVSGIMCYFIYYLRKDNRSIWWTFINLLCISITTIISLTVTIILYNFTYLSPKFNLFLNGAITFFWLLGLGLLSMTLKTTHILGKECTTRNWGTPEAVGVCRDYQALWSMTLVGSVSTVAAFLLDIHTQRKTVRRGVYDMPEDDRDTQQLNNLKSNRIISAGYDRPSEHNETSTSIFDADIGYHNRYGEEEHESGVIPHGPLGGHEGGDLRYHNQSFRD